MKKIKIEVTDNYEGSEMNKGCFDVEISSKVAGVERKIKAFVNEKNHVSVRSGVWIHSLFKNAPFTSEYVQKANDAIQESFKDWNHSITELNVNI